MLNESYEATLRLFRFGEAGAPILRVLRLAAEFSNCATALLVAESDDAFEMVLSHGMPLSEFAPRLPRDETDTDANGAMILSDLANHPVWRNLPFVIGPLAWRYLVSVPLPLPHLPRRIMLVCADSDDSRPRPSSLAQVLESAARIAADELRLLGDIALMGERLAAVRQSADNVVAAVSDSAVAMAVLDANGAIGLGNATFRRLVAEGIADPVGQRLAALYPAAADRIDTAIAAAIGQGVAAPAVEIAAGGVVADFLPVSGSNPLARQCLAIFSPQRVVRTPAPGEDSTAERPQVVSRFLLDTVLPQRRVLRRKAISYHALVRWKRGIQPAQIAALRALKADLPDAFVDEVGRQLMLAAAQLFGRETFRAIVGVPCGNSGPNCLSQRLARVVAEGFELPLIDAFSPLDVRGSSHPRRNIARPRMTLQQAVTMPVLLIDDVATSGSHIEEAATRLLAAGAPAVLPLVWLAP